MSFLPKSISLARARAYTDVLVPPPPESLCQYIRKIRQYFESDKRIKLVTLRGVGYHFTITSSNS